MNSKTIKALENIFGHIEHDRPKKLNKMKQISILDSATVCMVKSKTAVARDVLALFVHEDFDMELMKHNNKNDLMKGNKGPGPSKFDIGYLQKVIDVLKTCDDYGAESLTLEVCKDWPIRLSNEHFEFIIAPRVDEG